MIFPAMARSTGTAPDPAYLAVGVSAEKDLQMTTLRSFEDIFALAAARKGGADAFEATLPNPKPATELAAIPDDRWLAAMTRAVFQAGFSWKVIENKWPGFEVAFWGFDPGRCSMMSDDDLDALVQDKNIVRNGAKIRAVAENATFLRELAAEHGTAASSFANWPAEDLIDNRPTPSIFIWSVISILGLLAGIGALVWYMAARKKDEEHSVPGEDPLLGLKPTPSMLATVKYFWVVAALSR